MQNNTNDGNNENRNLSEVFKELQNSRNSSSNVTSNKKAHKTSNKNYSIKASKVIKPQKIKSKKTKHVKPQKQRFAIIKNKFHILKSNKKKFKQFVIVTSIYIVIVFGLIAGIIVYAINSNKTENPYGDFAKYEKNSNPFNISQILLNNTETIRTKENTYRDKEIPYSTKFIENSSLPKDEKIVKQKGVPGLERINIVRTYEGEDLIDESTSNISILKAPVEEIVEVGTSDFLVNYNVHLGDIMYIINTTSLMDSMTNGSEICKITRYMDVTLLEVIGEWCKVSYEGQEGYVLASALTSQSATPGIVSQNKVQRIVSRLNFNMQLNVKSGLSLADFKRVLSGESKDKNKVIEQNAEAFYNAEQKYNVNGILLAAMAVHESGWGTSAISLQKKNLFGYGAYDRDPYNSAYSYDTYAEGIDFVAKMLAKTYLNPAGVTLGDGDVSTGRYYTSPTLIGINTKYSTDPNWCTKVFSYMTYFYDKL